MRKLVTSALAGLALVGTTIGAAMPAEAQRGGFHSGGGFRGGGGWHGGGGWRGGGYHRGWGGGGAVAAGIIGLGVGAALASRSYYGRGYGYAPGYAYGYGAPYGYGGCYTTQRWDPYYGGYVPVRYCD